MIIKLPKYTTIEVKEFEIEYDNSDSFRENPSYELGIKKRNELITAYHKDKIKGDSYSPSYPSAISCIIDGKT